MVQVRPFRGIRYDLTRAGNPIDLVAPPLHAISPDDQTALKSKGPYNVTHLVGEEVPSAASDASSEMRLARNSVENWLDRGILKRDRDRAFYLYEQSYSMPNERRTRHGFLGLLALEPYDRGRVLPHEKCHPHTTAKMLGQMQAARANISPVSFWYEDTTGATDEILTSPQSAFPDLALTDDQGIEHRLFLMTSQFEIKQIVSNLSDKVLLIADNHAGYEAALAFQHFQQNTPMGERGGQGQAGDYVLAYLTNSADIATMMLPYHRVIRSLPDFAFPAFIKRLGERFHLHPLSSLRNQERMQSMLQQAGRDGPAFIILGGGAIGRRSGYLAVLDREHSRQRVARIPGPEVLRWADAVVLEELVLRDLLSIEPEHPFSPPVLGYANTIEELMQKGRAKDTQLVVMANAPSISMLRDIGRSGGRLPEKTTHFVPEPLCGLVLQGLTEYSRFGS